MENFVQHQTLLNKLFFHIQRFSHNDKEQIKIFMNFLQNFIVSLKTTIIKNNNKNIQLANFEILKTLFTTSILISSSQA